MGRICRSRGLCGCTYSMIVYQNPPKSYFRALRPANFKTQLFLSWISSWRVQVCLGSGLGSSVLNLTRCWLYTAELLIWCYSVTDNALSYLAHWFCVQEISNWECGDYMLCLAYSDLSHQQCFIWVDEEPFGSMTNYVVYMLAHMLWRALEIENE